ncbi:MAG: LuxR C-terminal-related transcriptional regulator [Rikenellaceae bacterium]
MNKVYNILIIEPSGIVLEGLKAIIRESEHTFKIRQSESISEFVSDEENDHYDIILLNAQSYRDNHRIFNKFRDNFRNSAIIGIITSLYTREICKFCQDCICLDDPTEVVLAIIEKNLRQEKKRILSNNLLSDREKEVLKLLVKGETAKEIASRLFISTHTVVTHRKNISAKLGIKTTSAMAIYAVAANIITLDDVL